jgi:hypothetical protein
MEVTVWAAFATWGQFIMAIVTAIIAIITLLTKKRVEEIAELTAEQAKQTIALIENNEIMQSILDIELQRYGRESKLNILKERPYFIMVRQQPNGNSVQLSLRNKGVEATDIRIIDGSKDGEKWNATLMSKDYASTEEPIVIAVNSSVELENIFFAIEYQGHDGKRLSQKIRKVPGDNFKIESISELINNNS